MNEQTFLRQTAVITGGAQGIGKAVGTRLAAGGARVAVWDMDHSLAVQTAKNLGDNAFAVEVDIANWESVQNAHAVTMLKSDRVDVLINSAGIARHTSALDTTPEDYDAVTDINVKGAYFLSVGVAHGMIDAGIKGSIINVSSQMGHIGGIERGVYCATKHAVEGFTKALAIEFGPRGIRVNTLAPTFIRTPLAEQTLSIPERKAWIESKIKLGRIGELSDIMGPAVFLASDASALITGTSLLVDGGWTAG